MKKFLDIDFERAVRLLVRQLPVSDENSRKPVLAHDIRVGVYLFEKGYEKDVVIAGLLHDVIEWGNMSAEGVAREFGDKVAHLVLANSKNKDLARGQERREDMARRCAQHGCDAMAIKAADTLDSFKYYTSVQNKEQLRNHCQPMAEYIFKHMPRGCKGQVFEELRDFTIS